MPKPTGKRSGTNGRGLRPHDPLVCGIDRTADCDGCLANRLKLDNAKRNARAAIDKWEQLCRLYPGLRQAERDTLPRALTTAQLGDLLWTLLQQENQEVVEEALVTILAGRIGNIAKKIADKAIADYDERQRI